MNKKIVFSTGGTGGHLFPAINLMTHLIEKDYEVILVTDTRGNNFLKHYPKLKSYIIQAGTPTNKTLVKKIFSYFIIFQSIMRSIIILKKEKPNLVFGFGGYVSFPISFASRFFKIPLILYENNLILGRANKYLLPLSKKIFISKKIENEYLKKYDTKIYESGPILNKGIINYINKKEKDTNKNFSILVLGGSQGAEIFGKIIPPVITKLKNEGYDLEINQQCISNQKDEIEKYYLKNKIKNYVFEFEKDISRLVFSSNLAITRCGATTTAELVFANTPFIAIPLPDSIDNHQYLNAQYYKNKECCWFLNQDNLNTDNLFNLILGIIKDKKKLEDFRKNMKKNQNKNVYNDIEKEIKKII
jgi:UDP-N-acetylglucosamine--N-acetylmuramyl-(pentapeptide) pyrophosphoryl-undecaprenol N-acetylglucosamine transferase